MKFHSHCNRIRLSWLYWSLWSNWKCIWKLHNIRSCDLNFYIACSLQTLHRSNKYCLRVFVSLIWLLNDSIYRMLYHWSSSFSYSSFTFLSRGCIRLDSPCLHPFPYARRHFITNSITPRTARRFSAIGRFTRLHSLPAHVIMFY